MHSLEYAGVEVGNQVEHPGSPVAGRDGDGEQLTAACHPLSSRFKPITFLTDPLIIGSTKTLDFVTVV